MTSFSYNATGYAAGYKYGTTELKNWLSSAYNAHVETNTTLSSLIAQLKENAGYNPLDSIDSFSVDIEKGKLGNLNNTTSAVGDPYYKQSDSNYYMYTQNSGASGNYATAVIKDDGYLGPDVTWASGTTAGKYSIETNVCWVMNKLGISTGLTADDANAGSSLYSEDQLVALYKNLVTEMQGLQDKALSNAQLIELKKQIDVLDGSSVKGDLENKIEAAKTNMNAVWQIQRDNISQGASNDSPHTHSNECINSIFLTDNKDVKGDKNVDNSNNTPDNPFWNSQTISSDKMLKDSDSDSDTKIDDYTDNVFFKYFAGLRTNSNLTFEQVFEQVFPGANGDVVTKVGKDAAAFIVGDYSGIKTGDQKLGPVDVFKKLYTTQQMLALFKKYEDAMNKSNSMKLGLEVALQYSAEFDFRKVMAEKVLSLITRNAKGTGTDAEKAKADLLDLQGDIDLAESIKRGTEVTITASTSKNGYYGDTNYKPSDGMYGSLTTKVSADDTTCPLDPYIVTINGTQYVLGKDTNTNGNLDDVSEILGITDTKENPFQSLLSLDSNKDGTLSQSEMIDGGLILKAVDGTGKLSNTSFDMTLISGIDLKNLSTVNDGTTSGIFNMKMTNGRTIQGSQTFEDQAYFNKLFGKLVDLRAYQGTTSTASTTSTNATTANTATSTASTTSTNATTANTATTSSTSSAVNSISHQTLLNQINNMYSALIIDDTSNIESILDTVCWKKSTTLTAAQKIRIVDSIDPLLSVSEIETQINTAIKTLNLA